MPNNSSTTYALPSDIREGNGGAMTDSEARARRVQEQVRLRLAEKSTLPRQNGSASQYARSDYGSSTALKFSTYSPGAFTSKSSYMYSGSKTMGPRMSQRADFSSRSSGPAITQFQRMSVGGGVGSGYGGGGYSDEKMNFYQTSMRQQRPVDLDAMSVHSVRVHPSANAWMMDESDAGSIISERDIHIPQQLTQSTLNGYSSQMRQTGGTMSQMGSMPRSLSGTLYQNGGMAGGGMEHIQQQHSFRGPSHRTISRITNRQRMSMGSMSGNQMTQSASSFGRDRMDGGFIAQSGSQVNLNMIPQGSLSRTMSMKSVHSVGGGMDIYGAGMQQATSMATLNRIEALDMPTAASYLKNEDVGLQALGAAYLQHQCYNNKIAKEEVRQLGCIEELVTLSASETPDVRRYASGALRNAIFESLQNKSVLIEREGLPTLMRALKQNSEDEELRKNITGIVWNLSSKDKLKEKVAEATVLDLTQMALLPYINQLDSTEVFDDSDTDTIGSSTESEIFTNTLGCFRNLSSGSKDTRVLMRKTPALVESLVKYIKFMLKKRSVDGKEVENCICILRNLSFQMYSELPPTIATRLEGTTSEKNSAVSEVVGCFTVQSRKAKKKKDKGRYPFTEVSKTPKDMEWLWHPEIIGVYHQILRDCVSNSTSLEAATGALQNITAGDNRWPSLLSCYADEEQKILPTLVERLKTDRPMELRTLTGLMRNLSRHTKDKDAMVKTVVEDLLKKLSNTDLKKPLSNEIVINICGILNHLVACTSSAAQEICDNDGLDILHCIKENADSSPEGRQAAKSAATVMINMYHYKKLHKCYQQKGFTKDRLWDEKFL